jgi:hypothetical protein
MPTDSAMQVFCMIGMAAVAVGLFRGLVWFVDFLRRFKHLETCSNYYDKELCALNIALNRLRNDFERETPSPDKLKQ